MAKSHGESCKSEDFEFPSCNHSENIGTSLGWDRETAGSARSARFRSTIHDKTHVEIENIIDNELSTMFDGFQQEEEHLQIEKVI